ncbi:non-oxidative hydroxyarylic acid decarboxylases subunit D [Saccharopolyspora sp. 5N708]|uniref:non-oxidative hydroxyarylic acid decarboxylases subunit D n=1 Tax=Saccharopolyspora sp. 5N708 TaxID=3457424 RepID=UPI003FD13681
MMCPRCVCEDVRLLAVSPVAGVWQVLQCVRCLYTWRSTEPARRTQREAFPAEFRMTQADIDNAPQVPAVPPLRKAP